MFGATAFRALLPGVGVASVGEGVDRSWAGRRVIASLSSAGEYTGGGYAERAVVPADAALEVPDGLGLEDAIAALNDGRMCGPTSSG